MPKSMEQLSTKNQADLEKQVNEKREAMRVLRFGVSGGKVKNTKELKNVRKEIARLKTELRARAIQAKA
jgi:ribosomal protein L29